MHYGQQENSRSRDQLKSYAEMTSALTAPRLLDRSADRPTDRPTDRDSGWTSGWSRLNIKEKIVRPQLVETIDTLYIVSDRRPSGRHQQQHLLLLLLLYLAHAAVGPFRRDFYSTHHGERSTKASHLFDDVRSFVRGSR
jgi:hypothetical protein